MALFPDEPLPGSWAAGCFLCTLRAGQSVHQRHRNWWQQQQEAEAPGGS